jgi:cytochrome P450
VKIDLLDPASYAHGQPFDQFRWLREHDPVHRHAEKDGPGYWAITRYEDVRTISRDSATFSSEPTIIIEEQSGGDMQIAGHKMMLTMDPPEHTSFRKILNSEFKPRASRAWAARTRELAREIVDEVIERGECEFVSEVAGEMPSYVIAELMGIPLDDGRKLYDLTEILHSSRAAVSDETRAKAGAEMFGYAKQLIEAKRARPGNDLATKILHAEVDGRRLDDMDFQLFFVLLIDAGGDTTRNLVAGGMLALLDHPDQYARLRADSERLLPGAREEMLRFLSPVVYMRRTATRRTEIGGTVIEEGDKLAMYYGAANRDPAAFDRADRFDIGRSPNYHVAFGGGGAHFCLGAHLARIEIDALLREILARMPAIELTAEPEWLSSNFISGPRRMPVRFPAGPRAA